MAPLSEEIQQRRRQALSLFRRSAASDPPTDQVIAQALDLALNFLRADRALHAVRAAGRNTFLLSAGRGWEEGLIGSAELRGDPTSLGGHARKLDHPLVVEDFRQFPEVAGDQVLMAAGLTSALVTPVHGQRGSSSLLAVFTARKRLFSPEDAQFLHWLAEVIAASLYREDWRLHLASRHPNCRLVSDQRS